MTKQNDTMVAESQHLEASQPLEETSSIDWDDPHRAALADNPEKAEKLSWSTILAVMVSTPSGP
jgi:hypothetical protein